MPAMRKLFSLAATAAAALALCAVAMAEPMDGEEIYQKCVNCHGGDARQAVQERQASLGGIAGLDKEYLARQLRNFRDHVRGSHIEDVPGHRGPWHECSTMK